MKKIKLFAITAIATVTFASCSKNHTCTCTSLSASNAPGSTAQPTITDAYTYTKVSEETAKLNCQAGTNTTTTPIQGDSTGTTITNFNQHYTYITPYTTTNTRTCTLD
jgi:hypothetical protein